MWRSFPKQTTAVQPGCDGVGRAARPLPRGSQPRDRPAAPRRGRLGAAAGLEASTTAPCYGRPGGKVVQPSDASPAAAGRPAASLTPPAQRCHFPPAARAPAADRRRHSRARPWPAPRYLPAAGRVAASHSQQRSQQFIFLLLGGANHTNLYKNLIKIQMFNVNLETIEGQAPLSPPLRHNIQQNYQHRKALA